MKKILILTLWVLGTLSVYAQQVTVSGTVTDESGEALIGCSVIVKGANNAVITGLDGEYSITANVGDVLQFIYIGFDSQEEKIVPNKTVYNIVLTEDSHVLMDMVVVGYGRYSGDIISSSIRYDNLAEEEYTEFGENKFKLTKDTPVSTFSADVDKASYSNVRRFLNKGIFPPRDAVRTEELINYFPYNYKQPTMDKPISIESEIGICPWNKENLLCKIGLKTRDIPSGKLPASNFVFLIDVSGSMEGPTRLDLVKSSMSLLTDNLTADDKVSIVVYAGNAGLVLPPTSGKDKDVIKNALKRLEAGGSTAGGSGIQLAYKVAKENFIPNGNNRVILCTDGDFNVGVSSDSDLEELIEAERQSGVFLSILGYGMGNYKDSKMQVLAQKGNGNHSYIDSMEEANRVLGIEFAGTLYTVAKDVKLQVEFNPEKIESYRLIGYETRLLNDEDFEDDTVDSGDMGSGHTVTALYELVPHRGGKNKDLMLTVNMRYKDPQKDDSKLISVPVLYKQNTKNSEDFNFASAVAMFAQLIRDSEFKGNVTFSDVENLAGRSLGKDKNGYRKEFIDLVKKANMLTSNGQKIIYGNIHMDDNFERIITETDGEYKVGMREENGKIVVPAEFDDVYYIKGGIFRTELDDKYGLYQYYSGELTPPVYDDISDWSNDLFLVEADDMYGVLDLYGRVLVEPKYDNLSDQYKCLIAEVDNLYGAFNLEGTLIAPLEYDEVYVLGDFLIVSKNDKYGVLNLDGKFIVPVEYSDIEVMQNIIIAEKDYKYGIYNKDGKLTVPVKYDYISSNQEYLVLELDDKYSLVGADGEFIDGNKYDREPDKIGSGLFMVSVNDKYGLIDMSGKVIIPVTYEDIEELTPDLFIATDEKDRSFVYNSRGKKIVNSSYDEIELLYNSEKIYGENGLLGYLLLQKNDKYGLMDAGGKMILPVIYDDIDTEYTDDDRIIIVTEKNDETKHVDFKGKTVQYAE